MADEKYDAEGFLVVSVTKDQSEVAERFYATSDVCKRQSLLYLYEGKAHKAHGYASFDEYCLDRLKDDQTPAYRRQQIVWARVERDVLLTSQTENLLPMGNKMAPAQWIGWIADGAIRKHVALELAKLPSDRRREARDRSIAIAAHDHSELSRTKHIVKDMQREIAGEPRVYPQPPEAPRGASKKNPEASTTPLNGSPNATTSTFDAEDAELLALATADHAGLEALLEAAEAAEGIPVTPQLPNAGKEARSDYSAQIASESEPEVENAPVAAPAPPAPDAGPDEAEDALWARRMAALQSAMSMVRQRRISGSLSAQTRKDLSAEIFKISMWITDGK